MVQSNQVTSTEITEEKWLETYKPIKNHIDPNASYEGRMFETYGHELDYVKATWEQHPNRVWTRLEEDGRDWIAAGYHYVNRQGYFICEVDFLNENLEVTLSEPSPSLSVEEVVEALKTAVAANDSPSLVDNLGDGESITIDGTINIQVLTDELNDILSSNYP